jgi:hypothetical protein
MQPRRWTDQDFDAMLWHDCHVHSLRLVEGQHGSGELELDIDHILEWRQDKNEIFFLLAPATLVFHAVSGLRLSLDWSTSSAAFGPFCLAGVKRTFEKRAHYTATLWRLLVNWPAGEIGFEATGFTQQCWGQEVFSKRQALRPEERVRSA